MAGTSNNDPFHSSWWLLCVLVVFRESRANTSEFPIHIFHLDLYERHSGYIEA